jgi:hypothetical protein
MCHSDQFDHPTIQFRQLIFNSDPHHDRPEPSPGCR